MSYTHICIETATPNVFYPSIKIKIKKGDYCTLISQKQDDRLNSGLGYEFKEHEECYYCSSMFLPLPTQEEKVVEKTVYVTVPEEVTEDIKELVLN